MTAKQRLQLSPQVKDVASMVQSGLFEHCCDVAVLTFVENLTKPEDVAQAAAQHYQVMGAKRILAILKDLATIPDAPKPNRIGQLGPQ